MAKSRSGKEIKAVFFDMDGLLYPNPWFDIFNSLGIPEEHKRLKDMYFSGQFPSYINWSEEACKTFQAYGLTEKKFMEVINSRPIVEGAEYTFKKLKRRGYERGLLTAGIAALAARAREQLNLDYVIAGCNIMFNSSGRLERWELIPCDCEDKVVVLRDFIKQHNLNLEQCAYIGHEADDVPIMKDVGFSIAFDPDDEHVKKVADVVVYKKDLREILSYFPPLRV